MRAVQLQVGKAAGGGGRESKDAGWVGGGGERVRELAAGPRGPPAHSSHDLLILC